MKSIELAAALILVLSVSSVAASGISYSISVHTDAPSYAAITTIHVSGQISPAPGPSTAVFVRIYNPSRVLATLDQAQVNGTTGLYSDSFVTGGSSAWVDGTYTVNATWGAYGPLIFATTSFTWASQVTVTTSTSSTSSSSSTTTSQTSSSSSTSSIASSSTTTSSSSTTSSSTTSSSGGGGGIPEFPYLTLGAAALSVLIVTSYLLVRRGITIPKK